MKKSNINNLIKIDKRYNHYLSASLLIAIRIFNYNFYVYR